MTNRSAQGGARSSLHYGGEGALIHPPHQGVCGRHGTEEPSVTPGGLGVSACGSAESDSISESEVRSEARRVVGRPNSTVRVAKVTRPEKGSRSGLGKAVDQGSWKRTGNQKRKAAEEEQFHE